MKTLYAFMSYFGNFLLSLEETTDLNLLYCSLSGFTDTWESTNIRFLLQPQSPKFLLETEISLARLAQHCSQLPQPQQCETQTCSLNSEQIHKENGFTLLFPACSNIFLCWRTPEMPVWLRKTFPAKATISSAAVFLHFSPSTLIVSLSVLPLRNEQDSKHTTLTSSLWNKKRSLNIKQGVPLLCFPQ